MHAPPPFAPDTAGISEAGVPAVGASAVVTTDGRIDVAALLDAIATEPRTAGGQVEARVRRLCATLLAARGWRVRERPFVYSALPGRWGTPFGGALSIALLAAAARLGATNRPGAALLTLCLGGATGAAAAAWLARRGVLDAPWMRRESVNLEAVRDDDRAPDVWLVAHLDSKSQPVSIGLRAAGIGVSLLTWIVALAFAAGQSDDSPNIPWGPLWVAISVLGIAGGLPVAASTVGARSPGALDNASGVAAVLLAADRIARTAPESNVGVLLTSAEELGLAGARAWLRQHGPAPSHCPAVLNCDSIDDGGDTICMYTGWRVSPAIGAASGGAARALGQPAPWLRRLLPGVLTDSVAFTDAGWDAVTFSRGNWRTLARIHRSGDRRDRLSGAGIRGVAAMLAEGAMRLARRETGAAGRRSARHG